MTAELLVRLGGPVAAAGIALLILAAPRWARLGGLALWGLGMALFLPFLAPTDGRTLVVAGVVAGVAAAVGLAVLFRREPWALPVLALAAVPVRIPVTVGDTSANLLLPLYVVVAGAALALAWELRREDRRERELGPLAWPVALLVLWFGVSALWTDDVREGAISLFFFVLPFSLLAFVLARLPWRPPRLTWLYGLLASMALVFAGVGIWQWLTRDVFWNPKIIVGNAYAPFYRVNSVFWDPSVYGRFLVIAILASLAVLLFRGATKWDIAIGAAIAATWVGLVFSFSQSSFAALIVGVTFAAVLAWRWRAVAAVALVAAVMVPLGIAAPELENVRSGAFASSALNLDRATSGRFKLMTNGLAIARDNPVLGVGVGGFKKAYVDKLGLKRPPPTAASHNTPITVAAETGLVGLALFAWLVVAAVFAAVRAGGVGSSLGTASAFAALGLAAIVVHSQFYDAFFEDPITWQLIALAALTTAARKVEPA